MQVKTLHAITLAAVLLSGACQAQGVGGAVGDAMQRLGAQMYEHANQREMLERQHELEMQRMRAQQQYQAQPTADPGLQQLEAAHPGWLTTVRSAEFSAWLPMQPASVQALAASERQADAILLIDLFKRDMAVGR